MNLQDIITQGIVLLPTGLCTREGQSLKGPGYIIRCNEYLYEVQLGDPKGDTQEIYVLIDPNNNHVRYVGYAGLMSPAERLYMHIQSKITGYHDSRKWMKELANKSQQPKMLVIEELKDATQNELKARETRYYEYFKRKGANLLNIDIPRTYSSVRSTCIKTTAQAFR